MKNRLNIFLLVWAIVVTVVLIVLGVFEVTRIFGKTNLRAQNTINAAPVTETTEELTEEESALQWESDWVKYNGKIYDYNEDIMTFLIMGIDKADDEVLPVYGEINGGQADALFLLVFNPHNKTTKVIGVNRNTMADVEVYDEYNNYVTTAPMQIAVQHGFGDGVEGSCELQERAVSDLFFQLPIHGYAAINMSAIETINDAVGGVDVTPTLDYKSKKYEFKAGESVHLEGDAAFDYLQGRNMKQIGSSDKRLERQKQYLTAFINQVIERTKSQPTLAVDIYKAVSKQMTTDVSIDKLSYIASTVSGYEFDKDSFYTMKGETKLNGNMEEFYPDMDSLYDMFLEIFYEVIDVEG